MMLLLAPASARDDGRYANSPLKPWFDSLRSERGWCCSEADGHDTEYDIRGETYWVPIDGIWMPVPEDAVLKQPNKVGRAILWLDNFRQIRCFLPGAGT